MVYIKILPSYSPIQNLNLEQYIQCRCLIASTWFHGSWICKWKSSFTSISQENKALISALGASSRGISDGSALCEGDDYAADQWEV